MEGNTIHAQRKINPHAHPRRPQGNWHTSLGRRRQSSARQRPHAEAAEERGVGLTEIARAPADHVRRDKWLTQRPRRNAVVGLTEIARAPADHVRRDKWLTQRPRRNAVVGLRTSLGRQRPCSARQRAHAEAAGNAAVGNNGVA